MGCSSLEILFKFLDLINRKLPENLSQEKD